MKNKRFLLKLICLSIVASIMITNIPSVVFAETQNDSKLYLNEICTQNKNCLLDSYGIASDWIELYNASDTDIYLDGYGLSDNETMPLKWTFPSGATIKSGEYLIIFASKQSSTDVEYHTGFALSKSGETICLSNPQGEIIQKITTPALSENITYGRSPDGSNTLSTMTPTPNLKNNISVPVPSFSNSSGFYDNDFKLSLSSTADTTIYYTLDGSDPITSNTAQIYTEKISMYDRTSESNVYSKYQYDDTAQSITLSNWYIAPNYSVDKATIVRAVTKDSNGNFSDIITNTYLIMPSDKLEFYKNIPVISLVTDPNNLFDADTGIYVVGNKYIGWKNSENYDPSKDQWDTSNPTNYYSRGKEWERPVNFTLFENGKTVYSQNMGIRIKGQSTRNSEMKSFNIYARSEYGDSKIDYPILDDNVSISGKTIKKYDSISLRSINSPERIRDSFAQKLLSNQYSVSTLDTKPCIVFLDGEFWGAYSISEKYSDYYIQSNYDIPKENVAMIKAYDLEEGSQQDFNDFFGINLTDMDLSKDEDYQKICDIIDVQSLIDHYCIGIYLGTWDWPNWNFGVWRNNGSIIENNPYSDNRWHFMSYDFDYTMGLTYESFGGVEGYAYDNFKKTLEKDGLPNILFKELLKNDTFKQQFVNTYLNYANDTFSLDKVSSLVEVYKNTYSDLMGANGGRWYGSQNLYEYNHNYLYNIENLNNVMNNIETFFRNRKTYTLEDMQENLNLSGSLENVSFKIVGEGSMKINSITPIFSKIGLWQGTYSTDYPITVTAIPKDGYTFKGWSGASTSTDTTITIPVSKFMTLQANFINDSIIDNQPIKGDISKDNILSYLDILLLKKYLLGILNLDTTQENLADINEDNNISILDLIVLKNKILMDFDKNLLT